MPNIGVVDVHCHLFNAQYAVMELSSATWKALWGNYPHARAVKGAKGLGFATVLRKIEGVKEFAAWIARLVETGTADCAGNYTTEMKEFGGSNLAQQGPLLVAPLMMDIYFALDDNADQQGLSPKSRPRVRAAEPFVMPAAAREDFETHLGEIKKLVKAQLRRPAAAKSARGGAPADTALDSVFAAARKELLAAPAKARGADEYDGIEMSPGYKKHLQDLEALAARHPGKVFPFLAVDPRRIGFMKLVELKVAGGAGVFKGIKLYPPLGYLPTHPGLQPLFTYCSKHGVPITVHCSQGGMENFRSRNFVASADGNNRWEDFNGKKGTKSLFYAAPANWLPVLKRWPRLRVNFAHFGGGDHLYKAWMNEILQILGAHPNVYTDMSYFTQPGQTEVTELLETYPILRERLMFGTDFIMIMMDKKLGGLGAYFNRYDKLDPRVLRSNAQAFLGVGD